ncbi:nephrocystin-3-like [Lingula anatina]|uniref:Nephrocystin-3 n=1 Tax=Lingula anatina TaxID=7574 RepID=A0A2R2MPU8_LINAN|nr:nephrocystin-3-like [Lingula anatina]|eukprot:XP_023932198.1 nephrocystin-3-like [Lingula anatina]
MGTGSSFFRHQDEDDLGDGVIKRIPIEVKPRGKLGLRSVGSLGRKPKGGSLRSALSVDLENPEVERIRREFEMYRLNKENELANVQKKEQKLDTENKKLRTELQALQQMCRKLKNENDIALEAEQQALERAFTFENDRNKVQRQFKIFRETKENEIQNLLKAKRDLENKLSRLSHGLIVDDLDSGSRRSNSLDNLGGGQSGDWWTNLDSEPSMGSTLQLQTFINRGGPEFAHSIVELDGPFTNVTKDDWNAAAASLAQVTPILPTQPVKNTIRVYICANKDTLDEVKLFKREHVPELDRLVSSEGRSLVVVHIQQEDDTVPINRKLLSGVGCQVVECTIFLGFLGNKINKLAEEAVNVFLNCDNQKSTSAIFCFKAPGPKGVTPEVEQMKYDISSKCSGAKIHENYDSAEDGAKCAYVDIKSILKMELGMDQDHSDADSGFSENGGPEQLCGGLWDVHGQFEQIEALNYALSSNCQMGFEKYYERLNTHVQSAGPLPPLLISGGSGLGKSLLLAKWLELLQDKAESSGTLILYHFVGSQDSSSADPIQMTRRLTAKLMQYVSSPPTLTCDPSRLVEEFPRWLEKVSSKLPGGVVLALDSVDRFRQGEHHLKWLLDPLPVDFRVVVTVHEDTCPQSWRSWPTVHMEPHSSKSVKEIIRTELAAVEISLNADQESQVLTHCRTAATCNPLYVMLLVSELTGCTDEGGLDDTLEWVLSTSSATELYQVTLGHLQQQYDNNYGRGLFKKVLQFIYASRNGMGEWELMELISDLTWNNWVVLYKDLVDRQVVTHRGGVLTIVHEQAREAVKAMFFSGSEEKSLDKTREVLIGHFSKCLKPGKVNFRVADELPWLLRQKEDKQALQECLSNICVFQMLYGRGHCAEILSLWQYVGMDRTAMVQAYFAMNKKVEEMDILNLTKVADMYETLGRFCCDLGLLEQALTPLQRALEIREGADPDHPSVAQSLHHLAGLHGQWGKYATAEALYKQALDIKENAFGPEHYSVAVELDALAALYRKQDKLDLAEPVHKRAVSIKSKTKTSRIAPSPLNAGVQRKKALKLEDLTMNADSPELARTLNELGVLYYLQNNQEAAESFFKKSLAMREAVLGSSHTDVAQSLYNLAGLYTDRKQYDLAEPLYERALHIRRQHFPAEHPNVASVVKHLVVLYKKQDKIEKAEPLYEETIQMRERSFGVNHPSVATALVNLAVLHSQQNKYDAALPLYERALGIYEQSLGLTHPRVAETLRNLAKLRYDQGDFETAAKLYKRATEIKEGEMLKGSGRSSSEETASTMKNGVQR